MISLTAEVLELKANPKRKARGIVIEAELATKDAVRSLPQLFRKELSMWEMPSRSEGAHGSLVL